MTIEYSNSNADLRAGVLHHLAHSKAGRRSILYGQVGVGLAIVASSAFVASAGHRTQELVVGLVAAIGAVLVYPTAMKRWTAANTIKVYADGKNVGVTGWHRLTLREDDLYEESAAGSQSTRYDAINKISEGPDHILVYVNAAHFYVIPRAGVEMAALMEFIDHLKSHLERVAA
jgi:hypothetical protein